MLEAVASSLPPFHSPDQSLAAHRGVVRIFSCSPCWHRRLISQQPLGSLLCRSVRGNASVQVCKWRINCGRRTFSTTIYIYAHPDIHFRADRVWQRWQRADERVCFTLLSTCDCQHSAHISSSNCFILHVSFRFSC